MKAYDFWNKMLTKAEEKMKDVRVPFEFQVKNSFKMKQITEEQYNELIERYKTFKEKLFDKDRLFIEKYGISRDEFDKMSAKEQLEYQYLLTHTHRI